MTLVGARGGWKRVRGALLAALAVTLLLPAVARPADGGELRVRYRSAENVYLDAGAAAGLAVGDRLEVVRDGVEIATLEVVFVAQHSASCRIESESTPVAVGDLVTGGPVAAEAEPAGAGELGELAEEAARGAEIYAVTSTAPCANLRPEPSLGSPPIDCLPPETLGRMVGAAAEWRRLRLADGREGWVAASLLELVPAEELAAVDGPAGADTAASGRDADRKGLVGRALAAVGIGRERRPPARAVRPIRTRVSGSVSVEYESFADGAEEGFDYERTAARLSLRVRDIAGFPLELRVRMRTQENVRDLSSLGRGSERENRDRFYELSLSWDPPNGRAAYQVGRIAAHPLVGIGYIDGAVGEYSLSRWLDVGIFGGASSSIDELSVDGDRQRYGLFTRLSAPNSDGGRRPWEVLLGSVREDGLEGVSREFVTLQSRYDSGGRFSFFQRAEIDLNRGWRGELSDSGSQLSNLSISGTARVTDRSRLTLSYNRFERYRTEETRHLPEELFLDLLREGLRAGYYYSGRNGLSFSLNGGVQQQEGEERDTYSYGFNLRHSRLTSWGLGLGGSFYGFSSELTEGYLASVRGTQRLPGGHELSLTFGNRLTRNVLVEEAEDRTSQWARLGFWVELPRNLFGNGELEIASGDDFEGERFYLSAGYRF